VGKKTQNQCNKRKVHLNDCISPSLLMKVQPRDTLIAAAIMKTTWNLREGGGARGKTGKIFFPALPSPNLTRRPLPWNHFLTCPNSLSKSILLAYFFTIIFLRTRDIWLGLILAYKSPATDWLLQLADIHLYIHV